MPELTYVIGDATDPVKKPAVICHVCNNVGAWGRGFVMSLSKRNKTPETAYRTWYRDRDSLEPDGRPMTESDKLSISGLNAFHPPFRLGRVQVAPYIADTVVANMIAQEGIRWVGKVPPIRYDALESCLRDVYARCGEHGALLGFTVAMPRIGAVLSGGEWSTIEEIIKRTMTVDTTVYTLPSQANRWPEGKDKI